jgi:hypothetical protein
VVLGEFWSVENKEIYSDVEFFSAQNSNDKKNKSTH